MSDHIRRLLTDAEDPGDVSDDPVPFDEIPYKNLFDDTVDPPPDVVILYRPKYKKDFSFRFPILMADGRHGYVDRINHWAYAGLEDYDGFTNSQIGVESFLDEHASDEVRIDLGLLLYWAQLGIANEDGLPFHDEERLAEIKDGKAAVLAIQELLKPHP